LSARDKRGASLPPAVLVPHAGVGAVIFLRDNVLLIQRGKPPYQGWWALPGGKIEPGEAVEAAARRELAEETGITAGGLCVCGAADVIVHDDQNRLITHYVLTIFTGHAAAGEPRAGDDAMAARWVALDRLDAVELVPGILGHIENARRLLALRGG
jgi:8-oxo-dGTP diphosphatase